MRGSVAILLALAGGCAPLERPANDAAPPMLDAAIGFHVSADSSALVRLGGTASVQVHVVAIGVGNVTITASPMPFGVTANMVLAAPGFSAHTIVIAASSSAQLVTSFRVSIDATTDTGLQLSRELSLAVKEVSGAPDLGFGPGGYVTLDVDDDPTTKETPTGLGVDFEGFSLVVGRIDSPDPMTPPRSFVLAFRPEGAIDMQATTAPGILPPGVLATDASVQSVSRRWILIDSSGDLVLRDLQPIYNNSVDAGGIDRGYALAQRAYEAAIAGTTTDASETHVVVARLQANGEALPSFGAGGTMTFDFAIPVDGVVDVAMGSSSQPEVVVLAQLGSVVGVGRITHTGVLDSELAGTGTLELGSPMEPERALGIENHLGSFVVVTAVEPAGTLRMRRRHLDGTPDAPFGASGQVDNLALVAGDAIFSDDGRYVAVGTRAGAASTTELAVVAYTADGQLDTSFGDAGTAGMAIGTMARGLEVAVLGDDRILVAGTSDGRLALARFWP